MRVSIASKTKQQQYGVAFMVLVFMIALASAVFVLKSYDASGLRAQQAKATEQALQVAKQALLAFSAEPITANVRTPSQLQCVDRNTDGIIDINDIPYSPKNCNCGLNCPRPGDMPCPDMDNDGVAETACAPNQIGRLPWRTLGIDDLRDSSSERLWYAVSNQYKNNPRVLPLNSDSVGAISLKDAQNNIVYDASGLTGLVAVIIAPGEVITRADGLAQDRSANLNNASHYLDTAYGEDNASFVEGTTDGFVTGMVTLAGQKIVNDIVMPITRQDINAVIETRVLAEVMQAIKYFESVNHYYPYPADVTDTTCIGNANLINNAVNANCIENTSVLFGRVPAGTSLTSSDIWSSSDVNSILRGETTHNWFQQNGWREFIFYAPAPACGIADLYCSGTGYLTMYNSITPLPTPSSNNKQVVLIASGQQLATQVRINNIDKSNLINYLEDTENLNLDNVYIRHDVGQINNDRLISNP